MKYNIKATEITLNPTINDYLNKKLSHLDKFISPEDVEPTMCYVELARTTKHHKQGSIYKSEITIHLGGKSFRACMQNDDLNTAIDFSVDEMARELKSYKDKQVSLLKRGGRKIKDIVKGLYNGWR